MIFLSSIPLERYLYSLSEVLEPLWQALLKPIKYGSCFSLRLESYRNKTETRNFTTVNFRGMHSWMFLFKEWTCQVTESQLTKSARFYFIFLSSHKGAPRLTEGHWSGFSQPPQRQYGFWLQELSKAIKNGQKPQKLSICYI